MRDQSDSTNASCDINVLDKFIEDIKSNIIDGANITVPFKKKIIK